MQTDYSPFDTAANEATDADRKERQRLAALKEAEDWRWLMSGPRGRRIVRRLLAKTGLYQSSIRGGVELTTFHEGERNVGLRLMDLIVAASPGEYILMLQENEVD